MPPTSRKRKADAEGSSSAQSSSTGSKPKKKESAKTVERIRSRFRSRHTMDYPGTEEQFDQAWKEFMATKGDKSAAEFPGVPGFGSDGAARPATKRRKVSNSTPTTTTAAASTSRSPKKPTPTSNSNAAASTPASVARSTKKVSKAQLQAQARERARLAMQNDSSAQVASPTAAAASAKKATPTTKPKATPPRKVAAAAASPGGSARKQQPASRTTTASPGRRTTGTYRKSRTPPSTLFSTEAAAGATEDDNNNVLPKPPSRFPTAKTTTTPKAADVGLGSFTQFPPTYRVDAAAPAPTTALPRMRAKTPPQQQQQQQQPQQQQPEQEPVVVEQDDDDDDLDDDDYVPDDIDSDDDEEEEGLGLQERWQNLQPLLRKMFLTLGLPLLAALVIFFGIGRYNPSTGMWMIVGPTRQHYSCASQIVLWGKPCRSPDPANPYIVTDENPIDLGKLQQNRMPCYQDSPAHVLATLDESKRAQVDDINHYYHYYCDPNDDQDHDEWQSCPSNAVCYKGRLLDCLAPAWVTYEREPDTTTTTKKTPPVCVLSQAVNDTYTNLVNLIETWSIHHLCLVRTEGPAPRSFYTQQQQQEQVSSNVDNDSALVKAEDDTSQAAATDGIPMYEWTTLYRMIDEGVEEHMQGEWDWKLLQVANEAHKKQLVLSDGDATTAADGSITGNNMLSVGLATHRYSLAQRSKLPMSCKVSRGLMHTLELMGRLAWAILKGLFSMTWYCFKNYPKTTSITTLVVSIVLYIRHYRAKQRRHRKRVNDVRQKVLRHLQAAWSKQPGFGMQKGEVSVIQVRDEIVEKMFGYDEYRKRNDFQHNVWPVVVQQLGHDNRVKKGTRVIDGKRRSLWMWTASTAGESATQS